MNPQLIDEMSKQLETIEKTFLSIDGQIDKISPDLNSTIMFKKNILDILDHIKTAKEDIAGFREGKGLVSKQDMIKNLMEQMRKAQGGDGHSDGGGFKGFPPGGFTFPPEGF